MPSLTKGRPSQPRAQGNRVRILVVEDNRSYQMVAVAYLNRLGYQADVAVNGLEALDKLSEHRYPVILMDCQMPVMDGFEATIELRRREGTDRRTVVIALTANAMKRDREACERAGMDDFISKPMEIVTLNERLDHWLAKTA
jgi:CheY-like chemotaxis protein